MSRTASNRDRLAALDTFAHRHIGPQENEISSMLDAIDFKDIDALIDAAVPSAIRMEGRLDLPDALTESELLESLHELADRNEIFRSYIGMPGKA